MSKNKNLIILILSFFLLLGLAGCVQATTPVDTPTEAAQASEEPTKTPTQEQVPTEPPETTDEPTDDPTVEPTEEVPEPAEEVADSPAGSDYCVECHTNQQMLIDTAAPVEEVESENEGAG